MNRDELKLIYKYLIFAHEVRGNLDYFTYTEDNSKMTGIELDKAIKCVKEQLDYIKCPSCGYILNAPKGL